jgi:hypothetical protein
VRLGCDHGPLFRPLAFRQALLPALHSGRFPTGLAATNALSALTQSGGSLEAGASISPGGPKNP